MANEINLSMSLNLVNGKLEERFSKSQRYDQNSARSVGGVLEVGTAVQTVSLGAVSTAGYAAFRSLHTATAGTHCVHIGHYDGTTLQSFARLQRGDVAGPVRLASPITIGVQAITAASHASVHPVQFIVLSE